MRKQYIYGLLISLGLSIFLPLNAYAVRELTFEARHTDIQVVIDNQLLQSPWGYGQPTANYPTLADTDGDGDLDMYIGTGEGTIIFYRNTGGKKVPNFTLETRKFLGINKGQYIIFPTFADTDTDGDLDMYFGEWADNLNFYKNRGDSTAWEYVFAKGSESAVDVKNFAAPEFVDIDDDGDLDLFVGNFEGRVFFYENTGNSKVSQYILSDSTFNDIDLNEVAVPRFTDIDGDGDFDLFVGSDNGKVAYYKNIGSPRLGEFKLINEAFITIKESYIYPAFGDLDDDGDMDVFIGNNLGEMYYYRNDGSVENPNFVKVTEEYFHIDVGSHSSIDFADIDNDADQDMFILNNTGELHRFENTNTAKNPRYELKEKNLVELKEHANTFRFADVDDDNDMDIIVGYFDKENRELGGGVDLYKNIGSVRIPKFILMENFFGGIDVGEASVPELNDYDEDGDLDLFIGNDKGTLYYYKNTGSKSEAVFTLETDKFEDVNVHENSHPKFVDIDNDGDTDILLGNKHGRVYYYENVKGNIGKNFINAGEVVEDLGTYTSIATFDADYDGKTDLFVGSADGNVHHFKQTSKNLYPPEEVTNLNATVDNNSIMTIKWSPSLNSEGDLKEYRLYEKTGNSKYTGSTNMGKSTSVKIIEPKKTLTYSFKVTAMDESGLENNGAEIEVSFQGEDYTVKKIEKIVKLDLNVGTSFCAGFPDVKTNEVSASMCEAIQFVKVSKIFTGTAKGKLERERPINRAEVTKVLIEAFDFDIEEAIHNEFNDVDPSKWYANYIHTAKLNGIVEGYENGSFKPGQTINKVELLKVVLEIAEVDFSTTDIGSSLYDDIEASEANEWFIKYTNFAHSNGLIDTVGNVLNPGEAMTRQDVIQLLYRLKESGLAFE